MNKPTAGRCTIIYGTRPEAIKLAPVARALRERAGWQVEVINTGQHDTLMPAIMAQFGVTVGNSLDLVRPKQTLTALTARMIDTLSPLLQSLAPDCVLVQGDTISAFAGALVAALSRVPVGHVEAGLRTHQPWSPFPEEALRRMISPLTTWHFCPSEDAADNLRREHATGGIYVTGNPVVDALLLMVAQAPTVAKTPGTKRIIATIHRRENFDHLPSIFSAFRSIASWPQVEFVFVVHANPRIQQAATLFSDSRVRTMAPVDYLPWLGWLRSADLLLSDSGGLQEEASLLGVPLLVVREHTERPEVIEGHYAYRVGIDPHKIEHYARLALEGSLVFRQGSPYGTGEASKQIATILTTAIRGLRDGPEIAWSSGLSRG